MSSKKPKAARKRRRRFSGPCLVPFVERPGGIPETTKDIGVDFAPWAKKLCQEAEESFREMASRAPGR